MISHLNYQRFNGFCGIATLANTFREDIFLDYLSMPEFIPAGTRQMSRILQQCGYPGVYVEPFVQLPNGMKVQNSFIAELIMNDVMIVPENAYAPFILNVKVHESDKYTHAVSVLKFSDHLLYSDPNNYEYIRIDSIDQLFSFFAFCVGVWGIVRDKEDGDSEYCVLQLRHLFYKEFEPKLEVN